MKFSCGCQYDKLEWEDIPLDCPATWDMIGEGLTKGVFQLEKSLGRRWCKKLKPRSIEQLADVVSLIRPGCLEAEYRQNPENGKMLSITDTYEKIKSEQLKPEYIHPSLEPILESTFGVPVYQEQIMKICENFAGFTLQEADEARKAVGKKLPEKMKVLHKNFVKGAIANGNSEEVAETIFGWIDKFSGYGFNLSHAVGYAMTGYRTAYAKIHFPIEFFKSMLSCSGSKQDEFDEIKQLVHEARLFGINVRLPDVRRLNKEFEFTDNDELIFGLSHIKNVGPSALPTLKHLVDIKDETALFIALFGGKTKVKKNVMEAIIKAGALDYCLPSRIDALRRFRMLNVLTARESGWLVNHPDVLSEHHNSWLSNLVKAKIPRPMEKRFNKIVISWNNVSKELDGNSSKLGLAYEKYHLGMAISGSEVDLYSNYRVDTSCKDFLRIRSGSRVTMGVLIEEIRKIRDKRNQEMCFLKISDSTYMLDSVVVFASVYKKCCWLLEPGKVLMIRGKKQDTSLLVDLIEHL